MFSKITILAALSFALSVAAAPSAGQYKCNTGAAYCCNETRQAQTVTDAKTKAIIAAVAQGFTGTIGQNCSPITGLGVGGGASCSQKPVCCENNQMNGLVVIGCTPIDISL
ncbi:hydrophobin [Collybia nuda]|uniref:Hydrophobin n=1 Tax=Collybia nuda TaxID=64659 RepID=A0A9P6CFA2_9AGAR|nr:hydrophobin [Collybia nuda]KAF9463882.1 hydrophobin [Collybia nuda]